MNASRVGFVTITTLVLAALSVFVPIYWDLYKSKSALQLQILKSSIIVGDEQHLDKLQFTYDGHQVPSVTKIDIELANAGRTPILLHDVVVPPTISVSGQVLDARVVETQPNDLQIQLAIDPNRSNVTLNSPLLNPGDSVIVGLLVGAANPSISATARISNIKALDVLDRRTASGTNHKHISTGVSSLAVITAFMFVLAVFGTNQLGGEIALKTAFHAGTIKILEAKTPLDFLKYLEFAFPTKKTELQKTRKWLQSLPPEHIFTDEERNRAVQETRLALNDVVASRAAAIFIWFLVFVGVVYVLKAYVQ